MNRYIRTLEERNVAIERLKQR
ncbi:hypothetical protein DAC20_51 [Bacteroides phage DAC20]|nr:hypothetical protein DAC16_48 [Bacteroides phage DAC16]QIG63543.1 hypothetical protein DAC19_52 [Bacteroides phage DAC19]QIG63804.1 hypothetical protein DAC20_51 [Bacteroides phage DAC20]QIG64065.1 hypothetical protein DAC22_51 [Bacteroides phage DAC22]QIG64326.1 hypothetical protein DAC23_48 [Bacteroides phage DAC23]QIG64716.1 hypothetical protein SJC03_38 [Bacteroides phage SJC03]